MERDNIQASKRGYLRSPNARSKPGKPSQPSHPTLKMDPTSAPQTEGTGESPLFNVSKWMEN